MSNEAKIGLMATVVIAVFIWGYKFIQGKNLFSTNTQILVEFEDVGELQPSAPVLKNGLQIGTVTDIYFKADDMNAVIINLDIDSKLKVPNTAKAELYSQGVMGGRAVKLKFSKPCSGENCVESGEFIQGINVGLLGSLVDTQEIPGYIEELGKGGRAMVQSIDSMLTNPSAQQAGLGKILADLSGTLTNLNSSTFQLNKLLASSSNALSGTLVNAQAITGNLKNNDAKINEIIANLAALTNSLKGIDLKATVEKTNGALGAAASTMDGLQGTLSKANEAFDSLTKMLNDINAGKGSLGKLAKDEELYTKLNAASREFELLLQDVRLHPKRYTRILSKKEKEYEYPNDDPAKQN